MHTIPYLSGAMRPELVGEPGLGWMRTPKQAQVQGTLFAGEGS